jgi:hypothetical protein
MLKEMKKNVHQSPWENVLGEKLRRDKLKSLEKCQPISKEKVIEERKRGKISTY